MVPVLPGSLCCTAKAQTVLQSKCMPDVPRSYYYSLNEASCLNSGATPSLAALTAARARYFLSMCIAIKSSAPIFCAV